MTSIELESKSLLEYFPYQKLVELRDMCSSLDLGIYLEEDGCIYGLDNAVEEYMSVSRTTIAYIDLDHSFDLDAAIKSTVGDAYSLLVNQTGLNILKNSAILLHKKVVVRIQPMNQLACIVSGALSNSASYPLSTNWSKLGNVSCNLHYENTEWALLSLPLGNNSMDLDMVRSTASIVITYDGIFAEAELFQLVDAYIYSLGAKTSAWFKLDTESPIIPSIKDDYDRESLSSPLELLEVLKEPGSGKIVGLYTRAMHLSFDSELVEEAYLAFYKVIEYAATAARVMELDAYIQENGSKNIKELKDVVARLSSDKGPINSLIKFSKMGDELTKLSPKPGFLAFNSLCDTRDMFVHAKRNYTLKGSELVGVDPEKTIKFVKYAATKALEWYLNLQPDYRA